MLDVNSGSQTRPRIISAGCQYWAERRAQSGFLTATRGLAAALWEFLRDSTPSRLRSRFGDADYDWDYRVNTTSGAVGWRDRLLGVLHSPYQPTEPELFHEMLDALAAQAKIDLKKFTFVDLGSGKGRTLLMASDYPFRRILGVELLPSLHKIARENLAAYKSDAQRCFALESICGDATSFTIPEEPVVVYLFNPFPEAGLRRAIANLQETLGTKPRPAYVLYHNPQLEHVLTGSGFLRKIGGTHQYSIFSATGDDR
jgi:SAM-dependent methyltransferase